MIGGKDRIYVWEDTYYEYSGDTLDFRVKKNGTTVYEGYAEQFPDGSSIRIYINRIAREFLFNGDFNPASAGTQSDSAATATFALYRVSGTSETQLGSIVVCMGGLGTLAQGVISEPVNGHADFRMHLPLSVFMNNSGSITIN